MRPLTTAAPPGKADGPRRTTVPDPSPAARSSAPLRTGLAVGLAVAGVGLGLAVGLGVGVGLGDGVGVRAGVGLGVVVGGTDRDGLGDDVVDLVGVGRGVVVLVGEGDGGAFAVQDWLTDVLRTGEPLLSRASTRTRSVPVRELVHVTDAAPRALVTAYRGQPVLGPLDWLNRTQTPLPSAATVVTLADTVCGVSTVVLVLLGDADTPDGGVWLAVEQPAARAEPVPRRVAAGAAARASTITRWWRRLRKVTRGRSRLGRAPSRRRTEQPGPVSDLTRDTGARSWPSGAGPSTVRAWLHEHVGQEPCWCSSPSCSLCPALPGRAVRAWT